ncbi:MAG: tetratricopeptide repeat protein [Polyangiaceae bacterium]
MRDAGVVLFSPEIEGAYDRLETHCKNPFLSRTRYEDSDGKERFRESRLGKIQALLKYRNSLAHGYNAPKAKATHELGTYLPMLRDILSEARFMAAYTLAFVEPAQGENPRRMWRLMGASPPTQSEDVPACVPGEHVGLVLLSPIGGALPLPVLFDLDAVDVETHPESASKKETFLFEGNTRSTIIYTSSSGAYIEKASRMEAWRSMLAAKAIDSHSSRPAELSLTSLRAAATRVRDEHISSLVSTGKYLREVAICHPVFAERVAQFELGDYRGMIIVGESGSGKTTTLALHAEERASAGDVVLFYRGASLFDTDLQSRIVRDLGARDMYLEDLLASLGESCFSGTSARLRIIVDGVNEHPSDVEGLARSIDALVRQADSFAWCRVIAGIRTASYERLAPDSRFGATPGARYLRTDERRGARVISTPIVSLPPLDLTTVGVLYERYRGLQSRRDESATESTVLDEGAVAFRPTTSFEELVASGEGTTLALMRTPLMLRLLLAAFHRRALPREISFDEAMRLYFDHVVLGRGDPAGERPERAAFLLTLVRALDAASSDAIARDSLYEIPALKAALQNPQKDSAYVQLLELGVLVEVWDRDTCLVRFAFDKLHEFLLAEIHSTSFLSSSGALSIASRATKSAALRGALAVGWARACREGHSEVLCDALDRCHELPDDTRGVVEQVVRAVLEHLARARDASFGRILDEIAKEPSESDVRALFDVFDRVFSTGEVDAAAAIARTAQHEASSLEVGTLIAGALFRQGVIQQQQGDLSAALASHARARELALASKADGAAVLALRIDVVRSEILRLLGDTDGALGLLDACAEALGADGAFADAAEARRQQAILVLARGRREEGQSLLDEALSLARKSGDPQAETSCLISWGVACWKAGDLKAAEDWFEKARAMADVTGHVKSMSHIAGNLGLLCRERGALREAIVHLERQLALAERIGHRHSAAIALLNLGVLSFEVDELANAESRFGAARELFARVGDRAALAMTLNNMAALAMHRGRVTEARALCDEALSVAGSLPDPDTIADAHWLLANMAIDAHQNDVASAAVEAFLRAVPDLSEARRRAQSASLELRQHLAHGHRDLAERASETMLVAVRELKTRVDVHELPLAALVELIDSLPAGKTERASSLAEEGLRWLEHRPSLYSARLRSLVGCDTQRAPWPNPLVSPSPS